MSERAATVFWFTVIGLMAIALGFCALFTNASSRQSVKECLAQMEPLILRKTATLTDKAELADARIEHVLYGNESQVSRLAQAFERKGWQASVEPKDEIGWGATISEDLASFMASPSQRVREMCTIAEQSRVRYDSWWQKAGGQTDYVSQAGDGANLVEEVAQE